MTLSALRQGDIVDVVAPASACTKAELRAGLKAIEALGLIPRVPKNIFGKSILFSHSDERRLEDFKRALWAPDSKLIWCVRGGYGTVRLMPEILKWKKPAYAKILLGYSDITTLHAHVNQKWHWPALHGPLVDRLGRGVMTSKEKKQLTSILFGEVEEVEFTKLQPLNAPARRSGRRGGRILGGNMTVLQSGLGTSGGLKPKRGDFLFFEDIGERPHRVDRMLTQMLQAGFFEGCRGVLLGDFILANPKDRRILWTDVFARFAEAVSFPVLAGVPAGHNPKLQMTLPLGTSAVLHTGRAPVLQVKTGIRAK